MSYISYVRFDVKPGQREAFLTAFKATGMSSRPKAIAGYKWGQLNEATDGSHFMVIAEWDTQADYASWQAVAIKDLDRSESQAYMDTLLDPKPGKLFHTLLTSESATD